MKKQWPSSEWDKYIECYKRSVTNFWKKENSYGKTNKIRHILEQKIFQNKRLLSVARIFLKVVFKFIVN